MNKYEVKLKDGSFVEVEAERWDEFDDGISFFVTVEKTEGTRKEESVLFVSEDSFMYIKKI